MNGKANVVKHPTLRKMLGVAGPLLVTAIAVTHTAAQPPPVPGVS